MIALRTLVMLATVMPLFSATEFRPAWWQTLIAAAIGSALGQLAVRATRGRRVAAIAVAVVAAIVAAGAAAWLLVQQGAPRDPSPEFLVVKGSLTWDDVRAIETELPPAVPYLHRSMQLVTEDLNWTTQVVGTTPDYFAIRAVRMAAGRRFDASESGKVVVLGDAVVARLFGTSAAPIGAMIRIDHTPFTIIGVLAHQGRSPQGQDLDDVALVSIETYTARFAVASKRLFGGVVFVSATRDNELHLLLRERHRLAPGDDDDFTVRGSTPRSE